MYLCVYVCVCIIMKTICPPGYHHNGFVATHALGHIRTSCNREGTLFSCYIYIMPILLL